MTLFKHTQMFGFIPFLALEFLLVYFGSASFLQKMKKEVPLFLNVGVNNL